jgi:hypothetical protein
MKASVIHLHLTPDKVKSISAAAMDGMSESDLALLGVTADTEHDGVKMAMDAVQAPITAATIGNLVQFFQYWMPEAFEIITAKRNADALFGRDVMGAWEDEEIVCRTLERTGQVMPYSDVSDVPLVSYNPAFEKRTNVRFELGMQSGKLSDLRAARMLVNPDTEKRAAIAQAFAINQNLVAFNGYNAYNSSTNATGIACYGGLNDPNLMAYVTESNAAAFSACTFATMVARINLWMTKLVSQTKQNANPFTDAMTMGIAPTAYNAMVTTMNSLGTLSVLSWFKETYKNCDVIPVIELAGANGADDVAYIIMHALNGKPVVRQAITAEMRLLGVEPKLKGTLEGYTSGTAGVFVTQGLGIVRATGV